MELREVTLLAVAIRIFTSVVIGGIIGLERELKNRPAGLRTYMVVCLGSCLVMMTNQYICQVMGTGDPVRMGAQVVSGSDHRSRSLDDGLYRSCHRYRLLRGRYCRRFDGGNCHDSYAVY